MKKQSATESNKLKHASPTKRRWNSKVADLLAKTLDKYDAALQKEQDLGKAAGKAPLPSQAVVAEVLQQLPHLADPSDLDQLVDEAAILNIPPNNDNLKKINEVKAIAEGIEKDGQNLSDKKLDHKMIRFVAYLRRVCNAGVAVSDLSPLTAYIEKNAPLVNALAVGNSYSEVCERLEEAERHSKQFDADVIDALQKRKEKYRKAITKAEELMKVPQVCLINENNLKRLLRDIREQQFEFDGMHRLEELLRLIRHVRELAAVVYHKHSHKNTIDNELIQDEDLQSGAEEEELSDVVQNLTFKLKNMLSDRLGQEAVDQLESSLLKIRHCCEKLSLDDPELNTFIAKLESVIWKNKADDLLQRGEESEDQLVKLLQETPKDIMAQGCREYSQIKERVHAIEAAQSNEKRIVEKLEQYWDDEQLHLKISEIKRFVEETKSYILNKKIERKLEVLEQVARALQNLSSAKNKEDLVDEMSDLKLQGTKVFQKLSTVAKSAEKAEKQVSWLKQNKKKLQKYRETALSPSVRVLLEMPKMKISQAREIQVFLKGLPQALRTTEYDAELKSLEQEIHQLASVGQEAEYLLKQFSRQKFLELKYGAEEVRTCIDKLRGIVKSLFEANYKDEAIEAKLAELDLLVKSACLLDRSIDPALKRDISSWESTLKALKEWSKDDQRNGLMKAIVGKMKKAEKIMMEVHRMRQYESQFAQAGTKAFSSRVVTRQNKMASIEEARVLLKSYNEECQEIELEDTSNYLKTVIDSCAERLANARASQTAVSELAHIQEQLKKTPLNVEAFAFELSEKIAKANDFVKRVKSLSTDALASEMNQLREDYLDIGVKLPDFEKLSEQFYTEQSKCKQAEARLERMSLQELMRLRQEIMAHSFCRDKSLETKMLLRQVQMLEDEFARHSEGYDDDMDSPIVDLVSLESLNRELMEVRKNARYNYTNKGQFLTKLVTDVKSYLQDNVYSLDIDGLSRLRSHCFRKLVDLKKEITDHKIKLEMSQKPQDRQPRKKEVDDNRRYDAFGLFGNDFALVSRAQPQQAEPRGFTPGKDTVIDDHKTHFGDKSQVDGRITHDAATTGEGEIKRGIRPYRKKWVEDNQQQQASETKKPDVLGNVINTALRNYFSSNFKYFLETNDNFEISGLDALMAANTLERQVFDKYLDKAKEYDEICDSICKVLRMLLPMKHLSIHIRNKGFRLSILIKLIDKDRIEVRKIDSFARQKLDKNKGKADEQEIRVVDEEDELLDNIGEAKQREEANLHFSDLESDPENKDAEDGGEIVIPAKPSKGPRALCYDPETGQYQVVKNKFIKTPNQTGYTFYNIFKGGIYFETKEKIDLKKKPDRAKFYSCTGEEFIQYFTEIPDGLQLQPQLSTFEFEQYMMKVLVSEQAMNYLVLPFWVEASTPLSIKNFYRSNECLGSVQYSQRCKLFVFPKEYLKQEWLNVINFFFIKKELTLTELVGFIVLKLVTDDSYEVNIIPEPMKVDKTHRAYKFVRNHADIIERPIDVEILRETKALEEADSPTKETARYFDDIVDNIDSEGDRGAANRKRLAKGSKLQRLMNNDLSVIQSPHRKPVQDEAGGQSMMEEPVGYGQNIGRGFRGGLGSRPGQQQQMQYGMAGRRGPGRMDDLVSQDGRMSKISEHEDLDEQLMGKRNMGRGQPGLQSSHPPHVSSQFGGGYGGARPGERGGHQGGQLQRQYVSASEQRMSGQPGQFSHGGQMGGPQKMVKREFNNPPTGARQQAQPQTFGKPNYNFSGAAAVSSFDMNQMNEVEQGSSFKAGGHDRQASYGGGHQRGGMQSGGFRGGYAGGQGSQGAQGGMGGSRQGGSMGGYNQDRGMSGGHPGQGSRGGMRGGYAGNQGNSNRFSGGHSSQGGMSMHGQQGGHGGHSSQRGSYGGGGSFQQGGNPRSNFQQDQGGYQGSQSFGRGGSGGQRGSYGGQRGSYGGHRGQSGNYNE